MTLSSMYPNFSSFYHAQIFLWLKKNSHQFWSRSEPTNLGLFLWKCPFSKNELKNFQLNIFRTKYGGGTYNTLQEYIFEKAWQEIIYCNVLYCVCSPHHIWLWICSSANIFQLILTKRTLQSWLDQRVRPNFWFKV